MKYEQATTTIFAHAFTDPTLRAIRDEDIEPVYPHVVGRVADTAALYIMPDKQLADIEILEGLTEWHSEVSAKSSLALVEICENNPSISEGELLYHPTISTLLAVQFGVEKARDDLAEKIASQQATS